MKTTKTLIGIAICLVVAGIALASVTFNPTTGIGFVGKGDVQTVLGLNNAQMQAQASSLTFSYATKDTYEVVNAWATGNPVNPVSLNSHTATVTTVYGVEYVIAFDSRKNSQGQITGFNLTGLGNKVYEDGELPVVSPTVTYVTFTWDEQVWTGEWTQVPVYDKDGNLKGYKNGEKIYETVTHTTDQLPVDEDGNLYTEGNNKAVLSVTLLESTGGLYVNGVLLP
jgi:hypothetical protein